jgi:rhodanese-related sulfurtransferase
MLQEAKEVCPTTTRRLIGEGALIVDVREPREVQALAFDVPDLVLIPLSELETRWSEIPKDREVVMVSQGGGRSLKATYYLQYHGYTQVSNMAGGMDKWARKGFPVKGQITSAKACDCAPGCCDTSAPSSASDAGGCCGSSAAESAATACCGAQVTTAPAKAGCC